MPHRISRHVSTSILCLLAAGCAGRGGQDPRTASFRDPSLGFTVLAPDGTPAAGAKAVFVPVEHSLTVSDGKTFDDDPAYFLATADAAGRMELRTTADGPFRVCMIHDAGQADFDDRDVPNDGVVRLSKWATVQGVVRVAGHPQKNNEVIVRSAVSRFEADDTGPARPRVTYESRPTTDADGRYAATRMAAGPVSAVSPMPLRDHRRMSYHPTVYGDAAAGGTETIDLGSGGRIVVGKIVVPPEMTAGKPYVVDFATLHRWMPPREEVPSPTGTAADIAEKAKTPESVAARRRRFDDNLARMRVFRTGTREFDLTADGSFCVADVPPGRYTLSAYVARPFPPGEHNREQLGDVKQDIVVPAGDAAMPFDAGVVTAVAVERDGSAAAPDVDVPGLDDKPVRLADYNGKVVLVDFWASWCGPCTAEEPFLKAVYAKYAKDDRFVLIGMCNDDSIEKATAHVQKHDIPWRQGFLGGTDTPTNTAYGVRSWPSILLIGPDGKILARGLGGERIGAAVDKAMAK